MIQRPRPGHSEQLNSENHFIQFSLSGTKANPLGIGSKIFIYLKDKTIYQEQVLSRGFQSSVDPRIAVGLGNQEQIDSVKIIWPDDSYQTLYNIKANQFIKLEHSNAREKFDYQSIFSNQLPLFSETQSSIPYEHVENQENDFNTQFLLPRFYSHNGPCMSVGDINADGKK